MKASIAFLLFLSIAFASCEKNTTSKIPQISLLGFFPDSDSMRVNVDTCFVYFSIVDGDADLGNSPVSVIYYRDSRYQDQDFLTAQFPDIDPEIEDPDKGLEGTCTFLPFPYPEPRLDSIHMTVGDTFSYELYIKDRAGNESNHIVTRKMIIKA